MPAKTTSATTSAMAPRGRRLRLVKVAPMTNPSRERLKAELTLLRSQVDALEAQLLALKQPPQETHCHDTHCHGTATPPATKEDELDRRRASEFENRRLRALLWRQVRSGRRTIAALTGQTPDMLGGGPLFSLAPLTVRRASQLHDDHGQRFTLLCDDVDRAFTYLNDVFDEPIATDEWRSHGTFATTLHSRVFGQEEQQLVMESRESGVVAYDLTRCGMAVWDAIEPAAFDGFWDAQVRSVRADTKTARLRALYALDGSTVELTSTMVIKRFVVSEDRTVLVWRTVSSSDAVDSDVYIDETGWALYTREPVDADGNEVTRKRKCVQCVPRSVARDHGSNRAVALVPKTGDFMKLVLATTTRDTESISDLMENLLIDDCMRDAGSQSPASDRLSDNSSEAWSAESPTRQANEYWVAV